MAQTRRAGAPGKFLKSAEESRDFLKIVRNRPRARRVAYFAQPHQVGPVSAEFRQIQSNPSKWRKPTAWAIWQFLRFAWKSRDFLKILRIRPRIRGAAYFAPPHHVGPVFAEFRQVRGNPSKWRKPADRGRW